jgi:hypothetical protein
MVSFHDYEFQATLSANVCYCITADRTLSLRLIGGGVGCSVSVDFIFEIMLGSKENSQHFLFSIKSTLVLINLINLLIYRTTPHIPPIDAYPVAKFFVPDREDKVDSGIGLSYRAASLCSMADRYDYPMPESTISPSQEKGASLRQNS